MMHAKYDKYGSGGGIPIAITLLCGRRFVCVLWMCWVMCHRFWIMASQMASYETLGCLISLWVDRIPSLIWILMTRLRCLTCFDRRGRVEILKGLSSSLVIYCLKEFCLYQFPLHRTQISKHGDHHTTPDWWPLSSMTFTGRSWQGRWWCIDLET